MKTQMGNGFLNFGTILKKKFPKNKILNINFEF